MSHRFDPAKSQKLWSDERQQALPMAKLLPLMNIQDTDLIADIGAGNGYFTIPMAERARHVYAVDIEDQMLTEFTANNTLKGPSNAQKSPLPKEESFLSAIENPPHTHRIRYFPVHQPE